MLLIKSIGLRSFSYLYQPLELKMQVGHKMKVFCNQVNVFVNSQIECRSVLIWIALLENSLKCKNVYVFFITFKKDMTPSETIYFDNFKHIKTNFVVSWVLDLFTVFINMLSYSYVSSTSWVQQLCPFYSSCIFSYNTAVNI